MALTWGIPVTQFRPKVSLLSQSLFARVMRCCDRSIGRNTCESAHAMVSGCGWIDAVRVVAAVHLDTTHRCYLPSVAAAAAGGYLARSACHLFTSSGLSVAV